MTIFEPVIIFFPQGSTKPIYPRYVAQVSRYYAVYMRNSKHLEAKKYSKKSENLSKKSHKTRPPTQSRDSMRVRI